VKGDGSGSFGVTEKNYEALGRRQLGFIPILELRTAGVDGLEQFRHIHTGSRQQESMTITKAAHTVL
jgi:hypothetical protein